MAGSPASPGGHRDGPAPAAEQFIARVDVRELARSGDRFLRLIAPRFAEEAALGRHVRALMATHRWEQIHIVPHRDGDVLSDHDVDLYGVEMTSTSDLVGAEHS
jgi:hypothetical protein